ncbi:NACHT, LRR and PYD domains-containing protein 1b allele 2-like isoform X2 [Centrocercus urophasianus]|uniref:NACHT, LRR and PYD domains-containing protein 1b allele 2-like isoform X2 n=1 Tax=Centrocercus urophasianus TaxID=9002 RepID=UPI001C64982A|nr:NACHT, LRR and PYD domains-containing protein 1b allele 2-like isoform X2 [Centrocercus urophasianus]
MASGGRKENAVVELLWYSLEQLGKHALTEFKAELSKIQPKEGYECIELESVMDLSPAALASLLYSHFGQSHCVEVTANVLWAMGWMALANDLLDKLNQGARFVEWSSDLLIQKVYNVDGTMKELLQEGVLSSEQHDSIMAESTNLNRMQKLYELVPAWDVTAKYCLYDVLMRNNPSIFLQYLADTRAESCFDEFGMEEQDTSWTGPVTYPAVIQVSSSVSYPGGIEEPGICLSSSVSYPGGIEEAAISESTDTNWRKLMGNQNLFTPCAPPEREPPQMESDSGTHSGAKCMACPWPEDDRAEEVKPEITGGKEGKKETYRAHFPRAGFFRCAETELKFLVRTATTVEYKYSFWERHLPDGIPAGWMEAGPVFDIRATLGAVEAIHLPHFLCLAEGNVNTSEMRIGHVVNGNLLLENPDAVKPFHAELRDPSFSPMGVILLSAAFPFIPVHSLVLLYRVIRAADITLHLYLIPNNHGLEKVVDKDEKRRGHSLLVNKPPQTKRPLNFNTWYRVSGPSQAEINPQELKFVYLTSDSRQLHTEIYNKDLQEGMQLTLMKVAQEGEKECDPLWAAFLRAGDIEPPAASPPSYSGLHFVEQHREQLIQRVTSVSTVLDRLYGHVLSNEQYQSIRAVPTMQEQMRLLYSFVPSWDVACKDLFLDTLKATNSHLIQDLQGQ